jgi:hypothetical protein
MENNSNRRILIAVGFVLFIVIIILVWYFFYAKPIIAPSLNQTNNPLATRTFPPRFQFLNWGNDIVSTSTTEVTSPLAKPLVQVWNKPATGQTFTVDQILKEISATSTSGTTTIEIKKTIRATSSVLVFIDRTTGYVYGYPIETGVIYQISNTVIPGVYDATFFDNGKRVIIRYIDQEKNKVVGLIANVPRVQQDGVALPLEKIEYLSSQVISVTVNKVRDEASYVVGTTNGSAIYTVSSSQNPRLVSSSPFKEWDISYGGDTLYATTKPSAYIEGGVFSVPLFQAELAEKTGLMSTPNEGGVLLNSMWSKNGLTTFFSNNGTIRVLPFSTIASKCSWGSRSLLICAVPRAIPKTTEGLPDDWFQGRVSFVDDLDIIDSNSGEKYPIYSFTNEEGLFDITDIEISSQNDLFGFINKRDSTLWLLNTNLILEN